ncbi:Lissencephaly-1 [Malassezia sp. CBS 17886]|nr:Lissencephaly-1 [Malassezia sp. CBS 17886]
MSVLSDRQREELNKSILEYLHAQGHEGAFEAVRREAGLGDYAPDGKGRFADLLEKKWLSTIRLQKKIMGLESKVALLEQELQAAPSARRGAALADWYPRSPARHVLYGHRQPVTQVAFHPQFTMVATAGEDASIKIWDWETGELEQTLKGHTKAVQSIDFDHAGQHLVSCSSDLSLKVWDVADAWRNVRTLHGHEHSVSDVKYLPGDRFIVSASRDRTLRVWETSSGYCTRTLLGHSDWVRTVAVSDDARWFASGSSDQTVIVWDAASGEKRHELRGHEHVVECVAFAPVGAYDALRTLAGIRPPRDDPSAHAPGLYIASGSRDKTIRLWTQQGECLRVLSGHDNWVRALVFSPNGKHLLSVADDKTMRIWDLASGRCIKTVDCHAHFTTCIAWGRSRVAAPAANGTSSLHDAPSQPVNVVATGSVDLSVKIWAP